MADLISTERVLVHPETSGTRGRIVWSPQKTLWLGANGVLGVSGVVLFPHIDALAVFIVLTAITICAGHSVGMHRLLIHRSFKTYRGIEYTLVWLGTLVGMAGPIGMIKTHDMRDWHQRQQVCPPHPAHGAGLVKDAWWQLCCTFQLANPPELVLEDRIRQDRFYTLLERGWMYQQIPVALILYGLGGWGWVLWGGALRIFVSLTGHWMVGHFAHKGGQQDWQIDGVPVQGFNLPNLGWITFGENWHGNHHAFPHSAKLGLTPTQTDPGFWLIAALERLGSAWDIKLPDSEPARAGLVRA